MSEKYVRDILEKLEEIEKLHAKLRSLVPRVKSHDAENTVSSVIGEKLSNGRSIVAEMNEDQKRFSKQTPVDIHRTSEVLRNVYKASTANIKKLFPAGDRDSSVSPTRYFRGQSWRRLRSNSVDFVTRQWHDKGDRIKDFLSNIIERDVILVTRAAQTSDDEQVDENDPTRATKNEGKNRFSSRTKQSPGKRRRSVQEQLERLLEHFNYSRDSNLVNGDRVSTHRHSFGKDEPQRVQRTSFLPDERTETLRIVSSAERVSINDNRKHSLNMNNRTQKVQRKRATSQSK